MSVTESETLDRDPTEIVGIMLFDPPNYAFPVLVSLFSVWKMATRVNWMVVSEVIKHRFPSIWEKFLQFGM